MYLLARTQAAGGFALTPWRQFAMASSFAAAAAVCLATWWMGMRSGVRALDAMRG